MKYIYIYIYIILVIANVIFLGLENEHMKEINLLSINVCT